MDILLLYCCRGFVPVVSVAYCYKVVMHFCYPSKSYILYLVSLPLLEMTIIFKLHF